MADQIVSGRLDRRPPEVLFEPSFCDAVNPTMELEWCVNRHLKWAGINKGLATEFAVVITFTTSSRWSQHLNPGGSEVRKLR